MQDNRYSLVPVVVSIIKVIAILVLIFFLYQSIAGLVSAVGNWKGMESQFGSLPPTKGFFPRLATLLPAFFNLVLGLLIAAVAWGFAELFAMVRDLVIGKTAAGSAAPPPVE